MPRHLLLFFTCLAVQSEASPFIRRSYFTLDQEINADSHHKTLSSRRNEHHRNSRFVLPGSDPTSMSPRSAAQIFFPGENQHDRAISYLPMADGVENRGPGDAPLLSITTEDHVSAAGEVWFPGVNRDTTSSSLASSCGVGADLKYTYEGSTWKLLSRGRCAEREWVVMVAECQPGCRPLPCPRGQVEHRRHCVNMTDTTVCDGGRVLHIDQTGSTFCDCANDHFYYPWDGQCYARQERGPCDFGFYLDFNDNGSVECMPNYCQVDEYLKNPASDRCFRKDYVGYCPEDGLQFHSNNQTVECVIIDNRNIFDRAITRSCTVGSGLDHFGNCRSEFVIPTVTALPRSLTRGCFWGGISVGGGSCRRVNNYFF